MNLMPNQTPMTESASAGGEISRSAIRPKVAPGDFKVRATLESVGRATGIAMTEGKSPERICEVLRRATVALAELRPNKPAKPN